MTIGTDLRSAVNLHAQFCTESQAVLGNSATAKAKANVGAYTFHLYLAIDIAILVYRKLVFAYLNIRTAFAGKFVAVTGNLHDA